MVQNRKMELVDGGHLEFWYLDSSKYKYDARNGPSMPHLVRKVILHGFLWPFTYIFNMAAGSLLEFWWLDWSKYNNDARNGFSMPKLVGKVVLHSFPYQSVFKLHFQYGRRRPFWILASHKFRRHPSKSSNQVSNLTMLSVVTGPPDCTQLYVLCFNTWMRHDTEMLNTKNTERVPHCFSESPEAIRRLVCFTSLMASLIRSVGGLSKYFYQGLWLADLNADVVGQSINRRGVA